MFYGIDEGMIPLIEQAVTSLKGAFGRTHAEDMLITFDRNQGFCDDPAFMAAFAANARNAQEQSLRWRLHVYCWCARNALRRPGDFVECGVFEGFSAAVAAQVIDFGRADRTWYLYDTFNGIPGDQLDPGTSSPAAYAAPGLFAQVDARFEAYRNIEVIQGRVPEVLHEFAPEKIAFLHLDMNSAQAELGALETLFDRIVDGGLILLDDYGWLVHRQQKLVEDAFFAARGLSVLEMPTGQGLVIR